MASITPCATSCTCYNSHNETIRSTDLPATKYFCQYSKLPASIILDFCLNFCCCCLFTHAQPNQSKQNSVKGQFFYHSPCWDGVWTHIFNYTSWHAMTLGCLYFVHLLKSFWIKTADYFLQKQWTMCAAFADADASFLERLLSGWSLFPWFLAFFLLFVGFMLPLVTDS